MATDSIHHSRTCTKCGGTFSLDRFPKHKSAPDGRAAQCKSCKNESGRRRYLENREAIIERTNQYRRDNPDINRKAALKWRAANIEKARQIARDFHERRPDWRAQWDEINPDRRRELKKSYRERNKGNMRMRLNQSISSGVRASLADPKTKAGRRWEILVGYTVNDLIDHLEKKFLPGMSWENYGQWHIDHIIPLSAFSFETPDHYDFKRAWSLENLQPLWAKDNIAKSNRLSAPFQPSLAF